MIRVNEVVKSNEVIKVYEVAEANEVVKVNEVNFKRFIMIIQSTGIINKSLVRSTNALNFAYALFLSLREKKVDPNLIEKIVRKWVILSFLTSRYSGSPESRFESDIRRFDKLNP